MNFRLFTAEIKSPASKEAGLFLFLFRDRDGYDVAVTVQTIKIGKREFVLVAKRDFDRLAAQARAEAQEDDYWTQAALTAEAEAREKGEKPIPFDVAERELDARKTMRRVRSRRR